MKFYMDKYGELLTEKQFKENYFNYDSIQQALIDGNFTEAFITICFDHSKQRTIEEMLNYLIEEIQKDLDMFMNYLDYWDIEGHEIDDSEIIKALKES